MANSNFRCPATSLNVQHQTDDDPDISENEYVGVMCPACTNMHLLNSTERPASYWAKMTSKAALSWPLLSLDCPGSLDPDCAATKARQARPRPLEGVGWAAVVQAARSREDATRWN